MDRMIILYESIEDAYDTAYLRPVTVEIPDDMVIRIITVICRKTGRYGLFTIRILYGAYFCAR